jgi:hypothetical protein
MSESSGLGEAADALANYIHYADGQSYSGRALLR